jgi:hypothetical protein
MNICSECGKVLTLPSHEHRQVPVSVFGDHAHVDQGIAELIEACWEVGILTTSSCQGGPDGANFGDRAHIGFERGAAERFVGAATGEDHLDDPATIEAGVLGWRMRELRPEDDPLGWTWLPGGWPWSVRFSAHFPPSDIPELARRLRSWVHIDG